MTFYDMLVRENDVFIVACDGLRLRSEARCRELEVSLIIISQFSLPLT